MSANNGVLVQGCFAAAPAGLSTFGAGYRIFRILYSDGRQAYIETSMGELGMLYTASIYDLIIRDEDYKLEKGRLLRFEDGKWLDKFPLTASAVLPCDMSVKAWRRKMKNPEDFELAMSKEMKELFFD